MAVFAQTNLQLYNQMREAGRSADEIERTAEAYRLAVEVCGHKMRGSGKTLLAHLVGTASILVWLGRSVETVIVGLLHATYEDGDFGRRNPRDELIERVGEGVERQLARYRALTWDYSADQVRALIGELPGMSDQERELVLVRVANELEDNTDLAPLYHGDPQDTVEVKKSAPWRVAYAEAVEQPLMDLADALEAPGLADEIATRFGEVRSAEVPFGLRTGHRNIWVSPPRSGRLLRGTQRARKNARRARSLGPAETVRRVRTRLRR